MYTRSPILTMTGGLVERLQKGENIVIAEGYLWEFERRGYAAYGNYTPDVVLDKPELVKSLSEEYDHAGSDVIEAYTYFGHRTGLKRIDRQESCEQLNRNALRIAKDVPRGSGKLMAGNICNSPLYKSEDQEVKDLITDMFKEQIEWAVEEGADYIIGETFSTLGEAVLALEAIKQYGNGVPAVITMTPYAPDVTSDGVPFPEGCRQLEEMGAAVVGLNCGRGPTTMLPLIKEVRKACKGPIACLPVLYQTTEACPSFQSLKDPVTGEKAYPEDLDRHRIGRSDVRAFAEEAKSAGVQYVGLCCGNAPSLIREVASVYGREPKAMKYASKLSQGVYHETTPEHYKKPDWFDHVYGKDY